MKHIIFIFTFCFLSLNVNGQQLNKRLDLKFGIGSFFLGTGDIWTRAMESELNYNLNQYFSVATSLNFGYNINVVENDIKYHNRNINFYVSPFKNSKAINLRFGGGLSNMIMQRESYFGDIIVENYQTFGYNIIVENELNLNKRLMVGCKLKTTPYQNGDIATGFLVKFGVNLF